MRHLLVIAACLSLIGCDAFEFERFDIHKMQAWRLCPTPSGKVEAHLPTDADHCGGCGNDCGDGVTCVEGECNYSTRIHCGGAGRTCVGFEGGVDVDCVYVGDAEFDPALGPVARGYACAPVASLPMEPVEAPPIPPIGEDIVEPVELVVGDPPLKPDWILVPGRSTNCRDRVDRSCYFTEVEVRDVCGETCTAHIEHDFELMTTEMSRAMYRDLVLECRCTGNEPPRCVELCEDDADAEARPITGLSWCEAYEACHAVGGRLPTLIERARVEAMVDVDRGLFTRPGVCAEWVDSIGSSPRVAECFDVPETLEMDRVDGLEGAVPIGTEVLPAPRYFHHLFGNADEWMADPLDATTCRAVTQHRPWGAAEAIGDDTRYRVARGRSVFSPAGETGDRTIALDPSARAAELGVRCARTSVDTGEIPTPYDARLRVQQHAECLDTPIGYRAVRDAIGDRVYRGARACVDWRSPPSEPGALLLEEMLTEVVAGSATALARHPLSYEGPPLEVGQALFSPDEQWWLSPPARDPGDELVLSVFQRLSLPAIWAGEYDDFGPECAQLMEADEPASRSDGRRVVGQYIVIDDESLGSLLGPAISGSIGEFACGHFDCYAQADLNAPCAEACESWVVPVVVDFVRAESLDRSALCAEESG